MFYLSIRYIISRTKFQSNFKKNQLRNISTIHIHTYIHTTIHKYVQTYMQTYLRIHIYIHKYKFTYTHIHIYIHTDMQISINTYRRTCMYMYISLSLSIIWKSDLTDKMKHSFYRAAVVSILLYGCTTWALTKRLKKLDGNYTRMLRAILNKSWRQHPTRHQLYGHLPLIRKTIQVRRTRHAGHCWRSRGELISDVLLWTPTYDQAKAGRPARTYIEQLCEDTGSSSEDLPEAMNDREKWPERFRDICPSGTTSWWGWHIYIYIYIYIYKGTYIRIYYFTYIHT